MDAPKLKRIPFTHTEERRIFILSRAMMVAGAMVLLVGAFAPLSWLGSLLWRANSALSGVVIAVVGLLGILLQIALGGWLLQGARLFHEVAASDDNDQLYLVGGFILVRRVLQLKSMLLVVLGATAVTGGVLIARAALWGQS